MRRFIQIFFLGVFISLVTIVELAAAPREKTLKIYNWADYIDESLVDEFVVWYKEQTGEDVSIIYQTYDLNEVALAKVERAKADYDIVCPSDYIVERMFKKDLLLPLLQDFGDTPNYIKGISPYIWEAYDLFSTPEKQLKDYAVPFMWSTTGILYNKRTVTLEEVQDWNVLWDEKYKGRILMKDDVRQIFGLVQTHLNPDRIAAGVPLSEVVNESSKEAIAGVAEALGRMRGNVAGFEMDFGKELMTKEKADISIQYNGDAYWACREAKTVGVDLGFAVPLNGTTMWIDAWVIPKYAQNVKAASYFINFMCRPDNAVRNMNAVGYTPSVAAPEILEALIDENVETYSDLSYFFGEGAEKVRVNPILFADKSIVQRSAVMRDLGDKTEDMLVMWATVKGDNLSMKIVFVIIITIALMVFYYIRKEYNIRARRNLRRRSKE